MELYITANGQLIGQKFDDKAIKNSFIKKLKGMSYKGFTFLFTVILKLIISLINIEFYLLNVKILK